MSFINPEYYNDIEFEMQLVKAETQTVSNVDNVVVKVIYKVLATYNEKTESSEHEVYFPVENIDLDNITNFENLSESQVKSWVEPHAPLDALKHSLSLRFKDVVESEIKDFPFLGGNS